MNTRSSINKARMADIGELKALIETIRTDLGAKIDTLVKKLDEKDKKIVELENKVFLLEEKLAFNETRFNLLERRYDDGEQYSRRTSLRINGIPYNGKETADESLQKVKDEVKKLGLDVQDCQFDRAHRVGKPTDLQGNALKERQMIVKFCSFRARTLVYRNRKKATVVNGGNNIRFYIDQTKRRFQLRKFAVDYVQSKPLVDYAFVDINCNLCIKFSNGKYEYFNSKEELINLVG